MPDERKSFNKIVEFRKEKLEKLIAKGVDPYPPLYNPSHMSYEIIQILTLWNIIQFAWRAELFQ